jgi:co-chaperonin GroES (HSP10)
MKNEVGLLITGKRVCVRVPKIERMSKGGIALPDHTFDKESAAQLTGVVVDWGDEAAEQPEMKGIDRGDLVFFARYAGAGFEFKVKGVPYRMMNAGDILGKWERDAPEVDSQFKAAEEFMQVYGDQVRQAEAA